MRKIWLYLSLIIIVFLLPVCEEKIFTGDVDCSECFSPKPDSVDLIIHWTNNADYQEIPVVLYKGKVDEGQFIDTFYCFKDPAYIWVKANEEYAAKAIYDSGERTVIVVDGTKMKLKQVSDTEICGETCWLSENNELFLKLKF